MPLKDDWAIGNSFTHSDQNAVAAAVNKLPKPSADQVLYVSKSGNDSNDGLTPGGAKLTVAAALAVLTSGGEILVGAGTFTETAWTVPDETHIRGVGTATIISFATPTSTLLNLNGQIRVRLTDLRLTLTTAATASTLVELANSFRCSFKGVQFTGQHTTAATTTYRTQTGVKLSANAGDNRFIDCDFNNLGNGVRTDAIMNFFSDCVFGSCWKSVIGGDPAGADFSAGISLSNCVMTSAGSTVTDTHIEVTGTSNTWWIANTWLEGCDKGIVVGNSDDGPTGFGLSNVKVSAKTKCIDIVAAVQTSLVNIRFTADSGETPTDLTVDATNAPDGFAANLSSAMQFEIPTSTFPSSWSYLPRSGAFLSSLRPEWVAAPASASSTGVTGQMAKSSFYLYICTATNTWKRVAIDTW